MSDIPDLNKPKVQYSVVQLKELLELLQHITGKMPKSIQVSAEYYQFYKKESENIAKTFGIDYKKPKDLTFSGVRIVK